MPGILAAAGGLAIFAANACIGAITVGPVAAALTDDSPLQPREAAAPVLFMLTRPRHVTRRDLAILPLSLDL